MTCANCLVLPMCRNKLLSYLNEYCCKPYHYSEVYRAYFYEIRIRCKVIYDKYKSKYPNYSISYDKFIEILLEELVLGDLNVVL